MINKRRHLSTGGVVLFVNRNANVWSRFTSSIPSDTTEGNNDINAPIEVIVVFIIPGFRNPVAFSGTRLTIKSRKGPKLVQVEAAIPDIPFPENNPEQAKSIVLDLILESVKEVEVYANKNKIIKGELDGARNVIKKLWIEWNVSDFHYEIPKDLPYYDLPKVNEFTTRVFIEQLSGGGVRHYNVVLDEKGNEIP